MESAVAAPPGGTAAAEKTSGTSGSVPESHSHTSWIEARLCVAGENQETRQRKVQFTIASMLVVPAGFLWGGVYILYGEPGVAPYPIAYSVLTLLDLLLLFRLRRFELFRWVQQVLMFVLPIALQLALGGFVGSSLVILWSFIAVLESLLFGGEREPLWWLAAFVAAVLGVAYLEPGVGIGNHLPRSVVLAFFVGNSVAVMGISFLVLYAFVTDRRRMRQLEVAFLNQEMALRQSEKLATLGGLAAGVAHELNNPAAAARRASEQLRDAFARLQEAERKIASACISPADREALTRLDAEARQRAAKPSDLDPLARSDREAAVEEWLEDRGVPNPWELSPALAAQGLDPAALESLAGSLPAGSVAPIVTWASAVFPVYSLLHEIGEGTSRISEIVGALKSYSYVGQAPVQAVNLHEGIDNTLVILRNKLKAGIAVRRDYAADLPHIAAFGSELNQVWTNILDNAADAMSGRGEIRIRTRRENGWAVVEIEDDGPGIPEDVQPRIFDPFFTTKPVGKGTGLGLSTSHAIVTGKHRGAIGVESRPGRTKFTVRLPIELPAAALEGK
ncbi:MAG TPA: ATP-binding protein [Thermoanaerobaculia bacterium]|nr:ATP-binding protein [Thermoanaerobaculia bacterium]